jgi:hypothetical protein
MSRQELIDNTILILNKLPEKKIEEVSNYAEFLLSKIDDKIILRGIQKLANQSKSYKFLEEEEDLYTVNDLKERYK